MFGRSFADRFAYAGWLHAKYGAAVAAAARDEVLFRKLRRVVRRWVIRRLLLLKE
jgi:hypothetical protein